MLAEKQRTAAKRSGIERQSVEINQPRYFKNGLTFKKSEMYLSINRNQKCFGEEVLLLFPQEIRECGFVPGSFGCGLIRGDLLNLHK